MGGCSARAEAVDAATDTGTDTGTCTINLQVFCGPPQPRVCCHGSWLVFSDGPCWGPPDTGPRDAGVDASLSCSTPGETMCVENWVTECRAGRWQRTDVVCSFVTCG